MSGRILGLCSGFEGGLVSYGRAVKMPKSRGAASLLLLTLNDLGGGPLQPAVNLIQGPTSGQCRFGDAAAVFTPLYKVGSVVLADPGYSWDVFPFNYIYPWVDIVDLNSAETLVGFIFDGELAISPAP